MRGKLSEKRPGDVAGRHRGTEVSQDLFLTVTLSPFVSTFPFRYANATSKSDKSDSLHLWLTPKRATLLSQHVESHSNIERDAISSVRPWSITHPNLTSLTHFMFSSDELLSTSCNPVLKPRIRDFSTIRHSRIKDG